MIHFECVACGKCCRGPGHALISDRDVERLSQYLDMTHQEFIAEFAEPISFQQAGASSARPWGMYLRKHDDACVFLRDDQCTVHEAKPDGCRLGPLTLDIVGSERNWRRFVSLCPGIGEGPEISWDDAEESLRSDYELLRTYPASPEAFAAQLRISVEDIGPSRVVMLTPSGELPDGALTVEGERE